MKHINSYNELILERRNIGVLYHFTSLINLYYIITNDMMESHREVDENIIKSYNIKDEQKYTYTYSFTRDKNFHKDHSDQLDTKITSCIVIDGTKISDNYTIRPFNYFVNSNKHNYHESEQILITNSTTLNNISKYLECIYIPTLDDFIDEFVEYIEVPDLFPKLEGIIIDQGDYDIDDIEEDYNDDIISEIYYHIVRCIEEYSYVPIKKDIFKIK